MNTKIRVQVLALACAMLGASRSTSADAVVLAVPEAEQEQSQWCWAGVSETVLGYYGFAINQCEIADYTRQVATWHDFGGDDCCQSPSGPCNYWNYNWGYAGSIQDILEHFGGIANSGSGVFAPSVVDAEISAGRPFIPRWGWDGGGGHFLVGHGFEGGIETEPGVCDVGDPPGAPIIQEPVMPSFLYSYGPFELISGALTLRVECPPGQANLYINKGAPASPQDYDQVFAVPAAYTATEPGPYYVAVQALDTPPAVFELYRWCEDATIGEMDIYYMNPWYGEGFKVSAYDWFVNGSSHTWTSTNRMRDAPSCVADFDRDGEVGFADLTRLLNTWGECSTTTSCVADLNTDDRIGFADLSTLLSRWGPC